MTSLDGRTFLVTGANTGIGRATAVELARRGARVHLACRSETKARPVVDEIRATTGRDSSAVFLPLDLGSLDSVRRAAAQFLEGGEPLHVLVNNAGVGGQRGVTADGFELNFGVNHLGHFLLTVLLLDRLRASAPGRILNVSSGSHYQAKEVDFDRVRGRTRTFTGSPEYAVSKLCNVLFTQELARRLDGSGVTTYALHPGVVATDIWRRAPAPLRAGARLFLKSPEDGARTSVWCATAPELEGISGRYYDDCREKPPSKVATPALAGELWTRSAEFAGVA